MTTTQGSYDPAGTAQHQVSPIPAPAGEPNPKRAARGHEALQTKRPIFAVFWNRPASTLRPAGRSASDWRLLSLPGERKPAPRRTEGA